MYKSKHIATKLNEKQFLSRLKTFCREKTLFDKGYNNEDIFEMYRVLNQPYSPQLMEKLTQRNVMHKLTYKMDLQKVTPDGQLTLYGYLWNQVFDAR